jgi:hypothetical protein
VVESATTAARPKEVAGARPASQSAELGALAKAQLSGALRLVSAETADDVERYGDPQLVAAGKVAVLSLEGVQHGLGEAWQERKDEVFAFTQRVLDQASGRSIHVRVSDTDVFIIHPHLGRLAGQAACLRYLREIQRRFLGACDNAVGEILQVVRVARGRLETQPVEGAKVHALALQGESDIEPGGPSRLAAYEDEAEPGARIDYWTPFVAADGRTLRISATLEPVIELKGFTRIGFRMIRRVIVVASGEELSAQQVAALSTADLLRTDLATITRGIDRLRAEGGAERHLSLIVPVSFSSLSNPKGRAALAEPVREAAALVRLGVICEIVDIEGVPQSALLEVTSLLRPLSLLVVGRLANPTASAIARLSAAGFQALSFECPHGQAGDAEFLGWATAAVAAARKVAKSVLVYRAGSMKRAGALASLGATHVSVDAG